MRVALSIKQKLTKALSPRRLNVIDDSHHHAGHAGARPSGESHFRVEIVATVFAGKSRADRQRMVYAALADELKVGLHALALRTLTPEEDSAAN